jgi:hypothetical protein
LRVDFAGFVLLRTELPDERHVRPAIIAFDDQGRVELDFLVGRNIRPDVARHGWQLDRGAIDDGREIAQADPGLNLFFAVEAGRELDGRIAAGESSQAGGDGLREQRRQICRDFSCRFQRLSRAGEFPRLCIEREHGRIARLDRHSIEFRLPALRRVITDHVQREVDLLDEWLPGLGDRNAFNRQRFRRAQTNAATTRAGGEFAAHETAADAVVGDKRFGPGDGYSEHNHAQEIAGTIGGAQFARLGLKLK